jgi:plastocyanin
MLRHSIRLLAAGAILAIAACAPSAGSTGAPTNAPTGAATAAPAGADVTALIKVLDFKLDPATVSLTASTIALAVTNGGPTVHNVTVRDAAGTVLFGTRDLREGESETVTHAIAPGTYVLFCSLSGHESLGIRGTLVVTAP